MTFSRPIPVLGYLDDLLLLPLGIYFAIKRYPKRSWRNAGTEGRCRASG